MKPIFKVSLLAATVLLAVGCQKEESKDAQTTAKARSDTICSCINTI